jgi:diguanylate cyclase (GGDEF)-like protein
MKTKLSKKTIKLLAFAALLALAAGVFSIDMRISSDDITILVPYISIIIAAVWFIGNKTGALFVGLAIVLWFLSKTNLLSRVNEDAYIALVIKITFIILQYFFIVLLKRLNTKVKDSALFDELTGLHNRRGFTYLVEHELAQKDRDTRAYTFVYFDIDNFKLENDRRGHKEGDEILRTISMILASTLRASDISARLGGDEFCVFMNGTNLGQGMEIVDRINKEFKTVCQERSWGTTLSHGVITTKKPLSIEVLVNRGDELMYKAKHGGKNRIEAADIEAEVDADGYLANHVSG